MKILAETLAKDFIYARIDFYLVKGQIYFGEISFHHHSGTQNLKLLDVTLSLVNNLIYQILNRTQFMDSKINILIAIPKLTAGGAERVFLFFHEI